MICFAQDLTKVPTSSNTDCSLSIKNVRLLIRQDIILSVCKNGTSLLQFRDSSERML